jgi:hypothetical protein
MSFAMKLGVLFQQRASQQGGAATAAANGDSNDPITLIFKEIERNIKADPSLVNKGVYFVIQNVCFSPLNSAGDLPIQHWLQGVDR